jgi:hypothetical protein
MQEATSVVSIVIAIAAAAISWRVYTYQRLQSHFALVLALHQDLTSGEVAVARDKLGAIQYGDEATKGAVTLAEALTSYFTILWCFERLRAGERSLRSHSRRLQRDTSRTTPALLFMYDSIHWHVDEWHHHLPSLRSELHSRLGKAPDDTDSADAVTELAEILRSAGYVIRPPLEPQPTPD